MAGELSGPSSPVDCVLRTEHTESRRHVREQSNGKSKYGQGSCTPCYRTDGCPWTLSSLRMSECFCASTSTASHHPFLLAARVWCHSSRGFETPTGDAEPRTLRVTYGVPVPAAYLQIDHTRVKPRECYPFGDTPFPKPRRAGKKGWFADFWVSFAPQLDAVSIFASGMVDGLPVIENSRL